MITFVSTETNRKKYLCGSRRLLMDRRQLIVRTLCHCDILPRTSNVSNHEKSEKHKQRTPLQGQTWINIRKTPRQDIDKVALQTAVSMTCHCVIRTVHHLSEIMIAHWHGSTLEHIKLHRSKCACLIKNVILCALKTDLKIGRASCRERV